MNTIEAGAKVRRKAGETLTFRRLVIDAPSLAICRNAKGEDVRIWADELELVPSRALTPPRNTEKE